MHRWRLNVESIQVSRSISLGSELLTLEEEGVANVTKVARYEDETATRGTHK
jgi:hypothetical protein